MTWKKLLATVSVVVLCLACVVLLRCFFVQQVRDGDAWSFSSWNLKEIDLALWNYHDVYKKLPPAVVTDKNGKPLYSWRVVLLPFLEHGPLYKQFKLDEPWDSPHNKPLLEKMPSCYSSLGSGDDPPYTTRYQAFVGPGTAFEHPGLGLADIRDGRSYTLLIAEAATPVPWSKPVDMIYNPAGPLPKLGSVFARPVRHCYFVERQPGFHVAFADGTTRWMDSDTADEQVLRALITRNGGEDLDLDSLKLK